MRYAYLLAALALAACNRSNAARPPAGTPVRVANAERINAPISLVASGVVEPMQTVAVTTLVTGTLLDVAFREGDFVKAGQVLFHIDPRPLEAAVDQSRAALARDEAQLPRRRTTTRDIRRSPPRGTSRSRTPISTTPPRSPRPRA